MNILFLGTSSGAGKSILCAMLCRYLKRKGFDAAPFKGSNLSSRFTRTDDGGMIGIGQTFQAYACGLEPCADMNPVMFVPDGMRVNVFVRGKDSYSEDLRTEMMASFRRLSAEHDILVCEGSGSPAEINIMDRDIANTGLMAASGVPAVIVGDIERGGVFAGIYGTWELIPAELRQNIRGFIINRFRGERSILQPGIDKLETMTGMKCLGVLRYENMRMPEEDSVPDRCGDWDKGLKNLDMMIEHAERDGFDFPGLMRMMGL